MKKLILLFSLVFATVLPVVCAEDKTLAPEVREYVRDGYVRFGDAKVDTKKKVATCSEKMTKYEIAPANDSKSDGSGTSGFSARVVVSILKWIAYIAVGGVVLFLLFLVWKTLMEKYSPSAGGKKKKKKDQEDDAYDSGNIHAHNYNKEIDDLVAKGDYNRAIRLLYLYCLAQLDKFKQIAWAESKTPTEYYYEMKAEMLKPVFFQLTNTFLAVRYGNMVATNEMYQEARGICTTIVKTITPVNYERK